MQNELDISLEKRYVREEALKEGLEKGRAEGEAKRRKVGRAEGLAQGKTEGLAEGRNNALMETARNLQAMGLSPEQIKQATGVTL